MEKKIEVIEIRVGDIKSEFGNPRKIKKAKREELENSLEMFGDFGLILIDESNNVIAGNQRVSIMKGKNPDEVVLAKRLVGYTEAEKRAINIKDNTHAGDWDLDLLAEWTADLNIDLGVDVNTTHPDERSLDEMELVNYEKYDYVLLACKDELSYNSLLRSLGLEDKYMCIGKNKRKIKARAIWCNEDILTRLSGDKT